MDAVTVKGLDKYMGRFRLKDINLSLRKGYITGLIGENGSGKSTLIHHMLTLKKQDEGRISILDKDPELEREELLNTIGLVFAEDRFPQNLSPKKLNRLLNIYYINWHADTFFAYLERFNVDATSKVKFLSTEHNICPKKFGFTSDGDATDCSLIMFCADEFVSHERCKIVGIY